MNVHGRTISPKAALVVAAMLALIAGAIHPRSAEARSYTYKVPGGGKLIVPRSSITDGARVVIRRAKGPQVGAGSRALGRPVSLKMRGGRLVGPVRLVLPLRGRIATKGMPLESTIRLAYYNASRKEWETVPAKVDRRRRTISARLTHFSWYNPLSWDWDSVILRLDQRLGELRGARTAPAKCVSGEPTPAWADTVTNNGADLQLRTCAEGQGDKVVVQIVNNRPFGMVLRYGAPVSWGWHETPADLANAAAARLMDDIVSPQELYLPALKSASVGVPRGDWWFAQFQAGMTWQSVLADLFVFTFDQADLEWRKEYSDALMANCSAQVKFGQPPDLQKDMLGWISAASNCILKALPTIAKTGAIDKWKIEKIEQRVKLLSFAGQVAEATKIAARMADQFIANSKEMAGNMSFSVRRKADSGGSGTEGGASDETGSGGNAGTGGNGATGGNGGSGGTTPQVPATRQIVVDNRVTNGGLQMREDTPAYLSTGTRNFCKRDGCALPGTDMGSGAVITAECTVFGNRTTNGQDNSAIDDGNPGLYSSTRWYGIRWGDGRFGYLSEVWIRADARGGLGLRSC